jgi:uncharacterized membrane protein
MKTRLPGIDLLRTVAIFIMIVANASPYLVKGSISYEFRLFCSLAAPIFIFLSGFVLSITIKPGEKNWVKWRNAGYLIATGAFIDSVIWGIKPFNTFDILYLIGFSLLINLAIINSSLAFKGIIWLAIILIHFALNTDIDYRFTNSDILVGNSLHAEHLFEYKRLFFDGWFPLFPWLCFSILGSIVGEIYKKKWINNYVIFLNILACALSSIYLFYNPILQGIRNGYVELFYPVELPYFLFTTTLTLAVSLAAIKILHLPSFFSHIAKLGEHSLFVYVLHTVIISFVLQPLANVDFSIKPVYSYSVFILLVYVLVKGLQFVLKKNYLEFIPNPIRQILGLR